MKKLILIILVFSSIISFGQTMILNENMSIDKTNDTVSVTGNLKVNGYITNTHAYHGFAYFAETTETLTITTQGTYYQVTNATGDLFTIENNGFSISGDTLICNSRTADYIINYSLNFLGSDKKNYSIRMFNVTKNAGIPIGSATSGGGTDFRTMGGVCYAENLELGDRIVMQVRNIDSTDDLTLKAGIIVVTYIHD